MSNKEMLHRKQYRIAAVVAGLALAVSMTACGAQKGTEGTESVETMENVDPVVPESVVASVEATENEKNAEEFGRETLEETSVPQGAANSAGHEMVTSGTDKVPGGEAAVSQSSMPTEPAGGIYRLTTDHSESGLGICGSFEDKYRSRSTIPGTRGVRKQGNHYRSECGTWHRRWGQSKDAVPSGRFGQDYGRQYGSGSYGSCGSVRRHDISGRDTGANGYFADGTDPAGQTVGLRL